MSDTSDPDAHVIRKEEYSTVNSNAEVKKTLRALGETRKKAKDLVVGSTHFLVNTTEKIGISLISFVNGETREVSLAGTPLSSSSAISGKTKRKFEPRHIPIVSEETENTVSERNNRENEKKFNKPEIPFVRFFAYGDKKKNCTEERKKTGV